MELLVKKAKRGDAEAFIELIEQNKQSMYKVARGFLRDEEDVADAMAETVLICYEKIGTLRQSAYFKTWMIRILINQCKDMIRKRHKRVSGTDRTLERKGPQYFYTLLCLRPENQRNCGIYGNE